MILVLYGFVVLLLLLSVRADRLRTAARFKRLESVGDTEAQRL
jgi:hypothetical protein